MCIRDRFFPDYGTLKCEACSPSCKECLFHKDNCVLCPKYCFDFLTPSSHFFLNSQCSSSCPAGSHPHSNSSNKLVFKASSHERLLQITANSTVTLADICCTSNCLQCNTHFLNTDFSYTGGVTQSGKVFYNQCQTCEAGFFLTDHSTSSILWGQTLTPKGNFLIKVCLPCDPSCASCSSSSSCTSCASPLSLFNNSCLPSCPEHYYPSSGSSSECLLCHANCSNCSGPLDSDCFTCSPIAISFQGKCVSCTDPDSPFGFDPLLQKCFDKCGTGFRFSETILSGLLYYSQCDDGNTQDSDGCSSSCQIEDSFFCLKQSEVDSYLSLGVFSPSSFSPVFQNVGVNLPSDKDICYYIGTVPCNCRPTLSFSGQSH